MKCPKCGYEQAIYDDINEWWHCPQCHGSGEVQMTEQEWLQTANTEQLAEAILQQWIHGAYHGVGEFGLTDKEIESAKDDIVEWLKQPHREE